MGTQIVILSMGFISIFRSGLTMRIMHLQHFSNCTLCPSDHQKKSFLRSKHAHRTLFLYCDVLDLLESQCQGSGQNREKTLPKNRIGSPPRKQVKNSREWAATQESANFRLFFSKFFWGVQILFFGTCFPYFGPSPEIGSLQQTRVYPYPLGAGSARPNPKMGAPDPEAPLFPGSSVLRGGLRPQSQTMVLEGARHGEGVDPERLWSLAGQGQGNRNS